MGGYARVIGYSSWSTRFLDMFSNINLSAGGGIQVWTKDAKFSRGAPSRVSSSWMSW
jgi:hypothetical protein